MFRLACDIIIILTKRITTLLELLSVLGILLQLFD